MHEPLKKADAGDNDGTGVALVEGLSFYQSSQPGVAKANAASDETMVAYFQTAPDQLTAALLDGALAAINQTLKDCS